MINKIILENSLFKDLNINELENFFKIVKTKIVRYKKNEPIYLAGDLIENIGIIIKGSAIIEKIDAEGNKNIYSLIIKGEHFGDSYSFINSPIMVNVISNKEIEVLFIRAKDILSKNTKEINKIQKNIIEILSKKNLQLSRKIRDISGITIRKKLISYLKEESILNNSKKISIPYNRQELSEYLNCNRSQLSKEITKLKKEGLVTVNKNKFEIFF